MELNKLHFRLVFTVFAVMALCSNNGLTDCPVVKLFVRGRILNKLNSNPVPNAQVFLFVDESETVSSVSMVRRLPDYSITHDDGTFENVAFFYTFRTNSFWGEDVCDRLPGDLEIFVVAPGFRVRKAFFRKGAFSVIRGGNDIRASLPALSVESE
jgi:hypothetical protein